MHDLDRTQLETGDQQYEGEHFLGDIFGETHDEAQGDSRDIELATELLEVQSEEQLEHFLGDLVSRATRAVGQFADSPTGQALGDILKDAARKALPVVGSAVGDYVAPGRGADWGRRVGAAASQLFEIEPEGLSSEDTEFELARRYVQWGSNAARRAAQIARRAQGPPMAIARHAATQAAHQYAPGLLALIDPTGADAGVSVYGSGHAAAHAGRWVRRGSRVVVYL
jgi:hypothetical protein